MTLEVHNLPDDNEPLGALPARQHRSERTRDAILAAAERALDAGALEKATVQEIARAAGISIGAFYGRFENKDAAMAALLNQIRARNVEELIAVNHSAADIADWTQQTAAVVFALAGRVRSLVLRTAVGDGLPREHGDAATVDNLRLADDLASEFARLAPIVPAHRRVEAARFTLLIVGCMTRDAVLFSGKWMGPDATREWFTENLARAVAAYLQSFGE